MKRLLPLAAVLLLVVAPVSYGVARSRLADGGAATNTITVWVGYGHFKTSPGSYLAFDPKYVDITVGDTVVFKDVDDLEPHTVTFGPMATLKKLADTFFVPTPQKNGPPLLVVNPQAIAPFAGHTWDGTGLANSGLIQPGKSWSLTFTTPGTYRYICLIHGVNMAGTVVVHPRPLGQGHMWVVQSGDSLAALNDAKNLTVNDSFYPRHLTIHVGDTVMWTPGFHTITFGPDALRIKLEKNLFVPVPNKSGPPTLTFNGQVAFPSGGPTYDGTGFVNSGVLALPKPHTFKLTFTKVGTYEYDCLIHPGMDGTITVAP